MKCDELKPLVFSLSDLAYVDEVRVTNNFQNPHDHAVYKATEVDAAIAEIKEELHDIDNQWNEQCKEIAELKAKNVRLNAENKGLKDENARLMSRQCYVCKDEQVKDLEKKFQELEGGSCILHNEDLRWRKTSEEIPSENDYYIVSDGKNVFMEYGSYSEQDEDWIWDHGGNKDTWKYWRPMPKAPEEEK